MSAPAKVAIITGCSSGIGLATTRLFLDNGYQVFAIDVQDFDANNLQGANESAFAFHKANLLSVGVIQQAVQDCIARFGSVSTLCNVAGVMDSYESVETIGDAQWERVMGINLTVPVKLMREVVPHMKKAGKGAIINVASRAAQSGASAGVAYTTSKHGLVGATKHTAWRYHKEGIRCNAVLPGAVMTSIHHSMDQSKFDQESMSTILPVTNLNADQTKPVEELMKSIARPDTVAQAIYFLASDAATNINGVLLPVDNAWSTI